MFYKEFKCPITLATLFLSIPLFARALQALLYEKGTPYYKAYNDNFAYMNTGYIIVSSIFPIVTQLGILVFGWK